MQLLSQIFTIVLILIGLIVSSLNTETTLFNYYLGKAQLPLSLLMLFSFAAGCMIGLSLGLLRHLRFKRAYRDLQQHCKRLEANHTDRSTFVPSGVTDLSAG